jgi:hypothetical protein
MVSPSLMGRLAAVPSANDGLLQPRSEQPAKILKFASFFNFRLAMISLRKLECCLPVYLTGQSAFEPAHRSGPPTWSQRNSWVLMME